MKPTVTPFLWFNNNAEEAANLYKQVFGDDVEITHISRYPANSPGETGAAMTVQLSVLGQDLTLLNGGPHYMLTEAFSLQVMVDTQEEVDRLWAAFTADGGEGGRCGWLKDKYGVSWQITPRCLIELLSNADAETSGRVMGTFMQMGKIVIAELEAAQKG